MKWPDLDLTPAYERRRLCSFGITEGLTVALAAGLGGGEIATAAAPFIAGGLEGAAAGAGISGITGGDPLKGALTGGLTGGAISGLGPLVGEATGLGAAGGGALAGAGAGALGAGITGGSPLSGAVTGGVAGLGAGLAAPSTTVAPTSVASGAGSAAGVAGSPGAATAAATSPIPLDPTAGGGFGSTGPPGAALGGTVSGGGSGVSGADALGLSSPDAGFGPTGPAGSALGGTVFGGGQSGAGGFSAAGDAGGTFSSADAGSGGFTDKIMGMLEKNPGVLLSGGLLASQLFKGNEQYPAEKQIEGLAGNLQSEGQSLAGYIQSGTLPPGAKQAVDSATNAAKATLRSRYAQMGLSGSTPEAQALAEIDQHAAGQTFLMADQLLQVGANYSGLAGNLYNSLLQSQMSTDKELQQSLMAFAGGLGGLRGGGAAA